MLTSLTGRKWLSSRGFTLFELLIVLLIISVVAAFVGPRLGGSMSNMELKATAKKIAAILRFARSQATWEGVTYTAIFDFSENRVHVSPVKSQTDESSEDTEVNGDKSTNVSKIYDLPKRIQIEKAVSNSGEYKSGLFEISFFPAGGSSGGEISLINDRERHYFIKVDFITGTVGLSEDEW